MSAHSAVRLAAAALVAALAVLAGCGGGTTAPPPAGVTFPPPDTLHIAVPGFPPQPVPPDNPTTVQGVALGRRLFYDPILSGDSTQACASCHTQAFAFSDNGRRFSVGIDHLAGTRNAPSLTNVGWATSQFWDGREPNLENQALRPVPNPIEMHETWDHAVAKLRRNRDYPDRFGAAFGSRDISSTRVVQAIAQFERTLVSVNTRYDRFLRREIDLSPEEHRGYVLFHTEHAECFHCHVDYTFTDQAFQNNALDSLGTDAGRFAISGDPNDMLKFKTPTLRNVVFSAPYMHDGRFATLEEVVDHYDSGGHGVATVSPFLLNLRRNHTEGHGLTAQDKADLIAFIKTLTDSSFVTNPAFASPFP